MNSATKRDRLAPCFRPKLSLTDYEPAMMKTIRNTYIEDSLKSIGCWFHYAFNVRDHSSSLGMIPMLQANEDLQKCLSMLMALPLLPAAKIIEGFEVFVQQAQSTNVFSPQLQTVCQRLERHWFAKIGVERISVYKCETRTNNNLESNFRALNERVENPRPGVWKLVDALYKDQLSEYNDVLALQRGVEVRQKRKKKHQKVDNAINSANQRLEQNGNVEEFLNRTAHVAAENLIRNMVQDEDVDDQLPFFPEDGLADPTTLSELVRADVRDQAEDPTAAEAPPDIESVNPPQDEPAGVPLLEVAGGPVRRGRRPRFLAVAPRPRRSSRRRRAAAPASQPSPGPAASPNPAAAPTPAQQALAVAAPQAAETLARTAAQPVSPPRAFVCVACYSADAVWVYVQCRHPVFCDPCKVARDNTAETFTEERVVMDEEFPDIIAMVDTVEVHVSRQCPRCRGVGEMIQLL